MTEKTTFTIAIIAHDTKKVDMVGFVRDHIAFFRERNIHLIATGTTGSYLEKAGLEVERMLSGPLGGDAQIASRMVEGKVDMIIFFATLSVNTLMKWMSVCSCVYVMYTIFHWLPILPLRRDLCCP